MELEEQVLRGREAECELIAAALAAGRVISSATSVRVAGLSGTGKTMLLCAASARARTDGWRVLFAGAHLVQEQIPLAVVKRLIDAAERELGDASPRYMPHSTAAKTSGTTEETFYRLIEGMLTDFPVLLVVDDVQWIDPESERVLSHALAIYADRPLSLLVSERGRAPKRFGGAESRDVLLGELGDEAIAAIARSIFPRGSDAVIAGIVLNAKGHPLSAAIVAREARATGEVPLSIRTAIAHNVEAMKPERREFLQLCSLIEEPIDRRLLLRLTNADEEALRRHIDESPDYLTAKGDRLFFSHAAVAEGVRQTIPVDVPYRKRVLDALRTLDHYALDEYERVARQAAACGERGVERDALVSLARESMAQQAWSLAVVAFARAFAIAEPLDEDFAKSYSSYASALIANDQPSAARDALESALEQASRLRLEGGFGELAAAYMAAIWYGEDFAAIPKVFARYIGQAVTAADRLALYSVLAFYRAGTMDVAAFEEAKRTALSYSAGSSSAASLQRLYSGEAILQARLGNYAAARAIVTKADALLDRRQPVRAANQNFSRALVEHVEAGIAPLLAYVDAHPLSDGGEAHFTYDRFVRGYVYIMMGRLDDALLVVEDALMRRIDRASARRILGISAAVSALRRDGLRNAALIEEAVQELFVSESESVVPLAAWWAAAIAAERPEEARRIARAVAERVKQPMQPITLFVPLPLALYAERARDDELLEQIANGAFFEESTRWQGAQFALARGVAAKALRSDGATARLDRAASELAALGAPLFGALAAQYSGNIGDEQRALLKSAGIGDVAATRPAPRQAQIAGLVSKGRTPTEIAHSLALSQRTVEHHIERLRESLAAEPA